MDLLALLEQREIGQHRKKSKSAKSRFVKTVYYEARDVVLVAFDENDKYSSRLSPIVPRLLLMMSWCRSWLCAGMMTGLCKPALVYTRWLPFWREK